LLLQGGDAQGHGIFVRVQLFRGGEGFNGGGEVEEALRQATDANARSYTHEEVMQAMQERIDRARDKPC